MTTLCLDNCLYPSRHALYKLLACLCWNFIPLFHHPLPQRMHSLGWFWILLEILLQIHLEAFNGIDVRGLIWPSHNFNVVVLKPLGCLPRGVFGVIVLLKHPLPLCHIQLFITFHHSPTQNLTV